MKNLGLIIISFIVMTACTTTYEAASSYDDVYYSPKSSLGESKTAGTSATSGVNYGNSMSDDRYQQTADPESVKLQNTEQEQYITSHADTLPPAESSSSNEYYYPDESSGGDYYDYDYAARIDRFYNPYGSLGYYAPCYANPYYGPSFSMGFGYGFPSSYFSVGFGYGYGYGYPYYYDPWYYDPWFYGYPYYSYYPYYGYSYWNGYNHGYWDGYYYGSGGYYPPGDDYYPGYYYGPRNSRTSNLTGTGIGRDSRVSGDEELSNNSLVSGRGNRVSGSYVGSNSSTPSETKTSMQATTDRPSRYQQPATDKTIDPVGNRQSGGTNRSLDGITSEKLAKPEDIALQNNQDNRSSRAPQKTPAEMNYSKPVSPSTSDNGISSRTKKYAKPVTNETQRQTQAKTYNSPNYNRPRSGNEYTVPDSKATRIYSQPESSGSENISRQNRQEKVKSYSSPSRSNNSFNAPDKVNNSNYYSPKSREGYTSPSRSGNTYTSPQRSTGSYSTPSRSSSGSVSAPSGGGSRSSGNSSGGSSSGGGGGKRGR